MRLSAAAAAVAAVLALAAPPSAGAFTPSITEHPLPSAGQPYGIDAGPDGALWFTASASNSIGRMTTEGAVTVSPLPTPTAKPWDITAGPDGAMWFTEDAGNRIGRITMTGAITEFLVPTPSSSPFGISVGPDGNLWFTEAAAGKIGRITPAGTLTEFPLPIATSRPLAITAGPDGNLWAVEAQSNKIARITTTGVVTEFPVPSAFSGLFDITAGPDGSLWFPESNIGRIGRITPAGTLTEFSLPTATRQPLAITAGPDDALWFTELAGNAIGRITTSGAVSEYPLPTPNGGAAFIARGQDGNLWFTEAAANNLGRITTPPAVGPATPSLVQATAATITAAVNAHDQTTALRVEYGPTTAYGWTTADQSTFGGTTEQTVSATVADLQPATTYHYRAVATNATGTSYGEDRTFTTADVAPTKPLPAASTTTHAPPRPVVLSGASVVTLKNGRVPIAISCPLSALNGCHGKVVLRLVSGRAPRKAAAKRTATAARCARGCRPLGEARFEAKRGKAKRVPIRLSSEGRKLLARAGKLKVKVTATVAAGGRTATSSRTIVVRART